MVEYLHSLKFFMCPDVLLKNVRETGEFLTHFVSRSVTVSALFA